MHFLYGLWGSAFTILFKRLVQEKGRNGESEVLKMIIGGGGGGGNKTAQDGCDIDDVCIENIKDDMLICK